MASITQLRMETRIPVHAASRLLSSHCPLNPVELDILRRSLGDLQLHTLGSRIMDGVSSPRVVLAGWVGWTAQLSDGRRQILTLGLPGDVLSPTNEALGGAHLALVPTHTADASRLVALLAEPPPEAAGLAAAWSAAARAAEARMMRHLIRLGRLSAPERIASLLVELRERQQRAGLADEHSMPFPLTQEAIADIVGLSVVHVNRVLQQLRREDLIAYRGGRMVFPDLDRLVQLAALP